MFTSMEGRFGEEEKKRSILKKNVSKPGDGCTIQNPDKRHNSLHWMRKNKRLGARLVPLEEEEEKEPSISSPDGDSTRRNKKKV